MATRRRTRARTPGSDASRGSVANGDTVDRSPPVYGGSFRARLFKWAGTGAWHFVAVPERFAPSVTHPWGRTPVTATVDGQRWETSVWRTKEGRTLLAVPKAIRGSRQADDLVDVTVEFRVL